MSLHALQRALADLFTGIDARDRYDVDPGAFCDAFDLDDRERAQLTALARSAIESYAATLVRKRRVEASRFLPETRTSLGERFFREFDGWANRTALGEGPGRYVRDAGAFCKHLLRIVRETELKRSIKADLRRLRA